jgi:putative exosortase-associated protein (TIGR04073 family)
VWKADGMLFFKKRWEDGTHHDIFKPDLMEGAVRPVGNKLLRGLGNGIFGFAEFPGQIVKGVKAGAPDLGIVKGLWYWLSREIGSVYDVTTFLLPNPADTKGLAFDEKWAWSALGDNVK